MYDEILLILPHIHLLNLSTLIYHHSCGDKSDWNYATETKRPNASIHAPCQSIAHAREK